MFYDVNDVLKERMGSVRVSFSLKDEMLFRQLKQNSVEKRNVEELISQDT